MFESHTALLAPASSGPWLRSGCFLCNNCSERCPWYFSGVYLAQKDYSTNVGTPRMLAHLSLESHIYMYFCTRYSIEFSCARSLGHCSMPRALLIAILI